MTRLLVVDDSALMRRLIAKVFREHADFTLDFARDGREALAQVAAFQPDVITLDVHMPTMDGLACLDRIMLESPRPVVMLSSLTTAGADTTLEALAKGAVDFMAKPGGAPSLGLDEWGPALVDKVRTASRARCRASRLTERVRLRTRNTRPADPPAATAPLTGPEPAVAGIAGDAVVLVGASTGGPPALDAVLAPLSADFPWPVVVAQHMPASFTGALARRLDRLCALRVVEAAEPMPLAQGHVYIARGDADAVIAVHNTRLCVMPVASAPAHRWHPSVDRLVDSAMQHLPAARLIGVLMTGMGNDGAAAMTRLRAAGGCTLAEAEETAIVWGMPGELVRAGGAGRIVRLEAIAPALLALAA